MNQNLPPNPENDLDPALTAAVGKIESFITQTTGQAPTPEELASAMTRYFVLNEILEFIQMTRKEDLQG